jgi:hypothetical protein
MLRLKESPNMAVFPTTIDMSLMEMRKRCKGEVKSGFMRTVVCNKWSMAIPHFISERKIVHLPALDSGFPVLFECAWSRNDIYTFTVKSSVLIGNQGVANCKLKPLPCRFSSGCYHRLLWIELGHERARQPHIPHTISQVRSAVTRMYCKCGVGVPPRVHLEPTGCTATGIPGAMSLALGQLRYARMPKPGSTTVTGRNCRFNYGFSIIGIEF